MTTEEQFAVRIMTVAVVCMSYTVSTGAQEFIDPSTLTEQVCSSLARKIHEFGKKEGLRCVRKTLLQALSHTQEAFTCETIPHDSL